jgi:hypothetical protein
LLPEHAVKISSGYFPTVTLLVLLLWARASRVRGRGP